MILWRKSSLLGVFLCLFDLVSCFVFLFFLGGVVVFLSFGHGSARLNKGSGSREANMNVLRTGI